MVLSQITPLESLGILATLSIQSGSIPKSRTHEGWSLVVLNISREVYMCDRWHNGIWLVKRICMLNSQLDFSLCQDLWKIKIRIAQLL